MRERQGGGERASVGAATSLKYFSWTEEAETNCSSERVGGREGGKVARPRPGLHHPYAGHIIPLSLEDIPALAAAAKSD